MYIGECALPANRGGLEASFQLSIEVGILFAYVLNWLILPHYEHGWCWSLASQLIPSLTAAIMFLMLPESPRWVVSATGSGHNEQGPHCS